MTADSASDARTEGQRIRWEHRRGGVLESKPFVFVKEGVVGRRRAAGGPRP